ncbi:hypothetical protein [Vibrio neptunius]|uniref:Peptidase M15A C-terminal domain-containing protein n=1 Tax=Vibrio neptunius TaxID=170651 RepID=A0ABS2ZZ14_9VIBR|nr:hypothetical protein [Vibrio neptunius]MBN3492230.1 hypothetical protein [Vibrio neptunius]MBN3514727.1 hypothetical protein [Vibrio neptunius]MBN3552118.1 hypothetical protein [Vibrio neptunius]MBN3576672.1 hypothetical protein [Vibrio neptunius]MCH9870336.1 hypothetical protein [Vibrio neptunius]
MDDSFEEQLVDWYKRKHFKSTLCNTPNRDSISQLRKLSKDILQPLQKQFGTINITYGFTNHLLLRFILKNSAGDMAPSIDQHASMELNSKGNRICKRDGAACDFYVDGYEQRMDEVAKYICTHLDFDRLYFYGKDRPIHISVGPDNSHYALIRSTRSDGLRVNTKSAKGSATQSLFDNL